MKRQGDVVLLAVLLGVLSCSPGALEETSRWTLSESAAELVTDPALEARIAKALDAAATAGTDPSISHYDVRAATVVEDQGVERVVVGGNSEYAGYPEAIHGETSLMNHVINHLGPDAARREVDFLAFYTDATCGTGGSCGDCRDYLMTTTRWQDLLVACGQASDHTVHVKAFAPTIVDESEFAEVSPEAIDLPPDQLEALVAAASEARAGGIVLFTSAEEHLGVAALTTRGNIYRAAGADDAAFHYRYPLGAALQQAATYRDYFVQAVVVVGAPGQTPRVSYRDRQYGYEFSSFNAKRGHPPIQLIVVEQIDPALPDPAIALRYRLTTFEEALPGAFSTAGFMPEAVDQFLEDRADR